MIGEVWSWAALGPQTGNVTFCEAPVDGAIVEPANAWSSMAYVAVGLWILARERRGRRGPLLLAGITGVALGTGSFALHATESFLGQFLDDASMFLLSSLTLTLALRRLLGWDTKQCRARYLSLAVGPAVILTLARSSGIALFGSEMTAAVGVELYLWFRAEEGVRHGALQATLATFAGAIAFWGLDLMRVGCGGGVAHVVNGHAAWHALTAASLATYCRYQDQFFRPSVADRLPYVGERVLEVEKGALVAGRGGPGEPGAGGGNAPGGSALKTFALAQ